VLALLFLFALNSTHARADGAKVLRLNPAPNAVAEPEHELGLAAAPVAGPFGGMTIQGGQTTLVASASYAYTHDPQLQYGASVYYISVGGIQNVRVIPEITVNFPGSDESLREAFFLKGGVGALMASVSSSTIVYSVFSLSAGKRFGISEHVSFRPNVSVSKVEHSPQRWAISPVEFSFFL
jgi:hypothetical protein